MMNASLFSQIQKIWITNKQETAIKFKNILLFKTYQCGQLLFYIIEQIIS